MKTLKLTLIQSFQLQQAHRLAARVLDEVKRQKLKGGALADMKWLETGVQHLEFFAIVRRGS